MSSIHVLILLLIFAIGQIKAEVEVGGVDVEDERIVGGVDASPGEFPHQVVLLLVNPGHNLLCGGSLITANLVITAGHCCHGKNVANLVVRVGEYSLLEVDPDQEE